MTAIIPVSLESLTHRLFTELAAVMHTPGLEPQEGIMKFDDRKYYDYGRKYLSVLVRALDGNSQPTIPFPIDLANISKPLKQELLALTRGQLDTVLKGAILRIYMDIDKHKEWHGIVDFAPEVARILTVKLRMVGDKNWMK